METPSGVDTTMNEVLPLNGSGVHTDDPDKRSRTITARLSIAKDTLTIVTSASAPGTPAMEQYKINEVWTILNSGSMLVIKKTVTTTADGDQYTVNAVYDKVAKGTAN